MQHRASMKFYGRNFRESQILSNLSSEEDSSTPLNCCFLGKSSGADIVHSISPPRRGCGGGGGYGGRKESNMNCRPEDLHIPFERSGQVRDVYLPKDFYSG
ncbi:hypothetical protein MKW98_015073 [Papaver atlanticum]|uniref:Uncharacterized protein n=1 Tax=Papaver atlanticum TaxID=357466 RepID=A0AAD4S710_9MAGN|nr:hypothetical protein MKW98_015073 [Papaver atlanticum]